MNTSLVTDLIFAKSLTIWTNGESAVIDLFLNAANSLGLPKSYGQIYGLHYFCRDEPLAMDEIILYCKSVRFRLVRVYAALRQLGASLTFSPGDRKERFFAEIQPQIGQRLSSRTADPHRKGRGSSKTDQGVTRRFETKGIL